MKADPAKEAKLTSLLHDAGAQSQHDRDMATPAGKQALNGQAESVEARKSMVNADFPEAPLIGEHFDRALLQRGAVE